ncbi:MAG: hypothetical protein KKD00_08535, partial [Gammaproteobacteria bacterium]|nr:hypothetical protein [Gammaproteobacteria bacterium]
MRIINQCLVRSMSSYQVSNTVRHLTRACGIAGLLAIFILTTTVFPTQTADAAESGTPSQHSILVSLYNDTAGGNWTNNNGWQGAAGTECSWHGVQCNGEGQVTGLNLNNNNLTGVLPGYLGQLSELNGLGLFDNNLSGTIPIELGQLSKLNYMDLGDNQLTGAIPVELGQLSNL